MVWLRRRGSTGHLLIGTALRILHDQDPDFMSRFILYFDGEKDPRNLMVVFSILRVPMTEWNIGADAQVGPPHQGQAGKLIMDSNFSTQCLITSPSRSDHLRMTHMESPLRT